MDEHATEESEGNLDLPCENLSDLVLEIDLGAPRQRYVEVLTLNT